VNNEPAAVSEAGKYGLPPGLLPRVCAVAALAGIASGMIISTFEHPSGFSATLRNFEMPLIY